MGWEGQGGGGGGWKGPVFLCLFLWSSSPWAWAPGGESLSADHALTDIWPHRCSLAPVACARWWWCIVCVGALGGLVSGAADCRVWAEVEGPTVPGGDGRPVGCGHVARGGCRCGCGVGCRRRTPSGRDPYAAGASAQGKGAVALPAVLDERHPLPPAWAGREGDALQWYVWWRGRGMGEGGAGRWGVSFFGALWGGRLRGGWPPAWASLSGGHALTWQPSVSCCPACLCYLTMAAALSFADGRRVGRPRGSSVWA